MIIIIMIRNNNQFITCEMLIFDPFEPATTMDLKLLNSDKLFCALPPVLSRQSFKIRLTCKQIVITLLSISKKSSLLSN